MMKDALIWLGTSWLVLTGSGAASAIGLAGWTFGLLPARWLAIGKWGGIAMLFLFGFVLGFREADERADNAAKVQALRNDNARLSRDLANQKMIAEFASGERDRLKGELGERDKKVADYEAELANTTAAPACDAGIIDARDLRWRRGLRDKRG